MDSLLSSFVAPLPRLSRRAKDPSQNLCGGMAKATRRKALISLPPLIAKPSSVVCMGAPYLITKLESAERTWKDLSVKLADPDVVSNHSEYQKLAQSMSELEEVVAYYRNFKDCEKLLEETKALEKEEGTDPDMADMISYEIEMLSNELKELEDKMKGQCQQY